LPRIPQTDVPSFLRTHLPIKAAGRILFLRMDEIDWIEAADNYVRVHTSGGDVHLVRETLNAIQSRLDPGRFLRIHRSTIVNLNRIRELRPWFHGDYVVMLTTGQELTLSRSYRDRVLGLVGI
jgi:two-component system LytT family response regulator